MTEKSASPRKGRRVTIADIAARAGVTSGAVSMAINGKPGVSDTTRARILQVASEMNWRPSHAAQALMGKDAEAIGLVLARPAELVGEEIFFAKFIAGVQSALSSQGYSLMLQMAEDLSGEREIHRGWVADGRVDGLILLDPRTDDPRIESLFELDIPAVVVGGNVDRDRVRSVHTDNAGAMQLIMQHLTDLGHQRVAFVTGDQSFHHTQERMASFTSFCIDNGVWGQTLPGNFDPSTSRSATERLMTSPQPPTALIYDSEVMAVAGVSVLTARGVAIPGDVSVVSREDSSTCQVLHPTVTALDRDAVSLGRSAAADILALIGKPHPDISVRPMHVVHRESTALPRA